MGDGLIPIGGLGAAAFHPPGLFSTFYVPPQCLDASMPRIPYLCRNDAACATLRTLGPHGVGATSALERGFFPLRSLGGRGSRGDGGSSGGGDVGSGGGKLRPALRPRPLDMVLVPV